MKNILLLIVGGTLVILYFVFKDEISPKSAQAPVSVAETMIVKTYFLNTMTDPSMLDCTKVYVVDRTVPKSVATAEPALKELLKGPSEGEIILGYLSSINPGTILQSLKIEDGIAYADFSAMLGQAVAGSCRVGSIRAQIENTLLQFPTVTSVVISIEGETEGILQP